MLQKLFFLFSILLVGSAAIAQPASGPAKQGMAFGQKSDTSGAIAVSELFKRVNEGDLAVKVKGRVSEVCTMEGCWLKMQTSEGSVMVKMKDHTFSVPLDINGKDVVVNGFATVKVTSVAEQKHYAEDAGKSKDEIALIQQPKKEVILNALGVLVL